MVKVIYPHCAGIPLINPQYLSPNTTNKMGELNEGFVAVAAISQESSLAVLNAPILNGSPPLPLPNIKEALPPRVNEFSPPPPHLYPLASATPANHTMGASLTRYLAIKVHQSVLAQVYSRIIITGAYTRHSPLSTPFILEKTDKPFNWERPTARHDPLTNTLCIECFPGLDHLSHYAEIISTYLALLSRPDLTPPSAVSYMPTSPSDTHLALRDHTNLSLFPGHDVHTVILGLVWHLPSLTSHASPHGVTTWSGTGPWQWIITTFPSGRRTAFLGFRPAFWGCISGEVIHFLTSRFPSIREFIYLGKLGTLVPSIQPNKHLATGGESIVNGATVRWESVLAPVVAANRKARECTIVGRHVTLGSVLHETREWYERMKERAEFVDPEIGVMAQAAVRSGVGYGYLHMVTDNLGRKYDEDLSNEREDRVLKGRERLHRVVEEVIGDYVNTTASKSLASPYLN